MGMKATSQAGLDGLRRRLQGGIGPVLRLSREPTAASRDEDALAEPWPREYVSALRQVRQVPDLDSSVPANAIKALSGRLRDRRPLMIATLFNPVTVLDHIEHELVPDQRTAVVDSWIGACWLAEAAWQAVRADLPAAAGFAVGETELLRPLAGRLRFLVGSEPMRARGHADAWWTDGRFGQSGLLSHTFGTDSWHQVAGACREARAEWLSYLNAYQSHSYLAQASPAQVEQELAAVIFRDGRRGEPLGISNATLAKSWVPLDQADQAVLHEVAERHLLPRFALGGVAALALQDSRPARRWARRLLALAVLAAGLGSVGFAAALRSHVATGLAVACYVLIGAGVVSFGRDWAAPWLLRMPAAATIGIIALISFLPGGWLFPPRHGRIAAVVLGGAAFCYLVVEVRNHGVGRLAVPRSLAVLVVGAVHALLVSLIGVIAVAPAFVPRARGLAGMWDHPGYGHAGLVLLLATAWCLAVGVFSQILWDDRPITAPLAHVSWRRSR
ncbi:MAG TPA: hypothetical protein VFQ44_08375 [Streptosporangiaceae bacterium]|nr:hypothetical protein [Streptosporangiaceae bacterium]